MAPSTTPSPEPSYIDWELVNAETPWTLVYVVLIAFQLSVALLILRRGRSEKSFRQAFFVLFVAVTIVDSVLMIGVSCAKYNN